MVQFSCHTLLAIALLVSGCAQTHYTRPDTRTDEFVRDYVSCQTGAQTSSYQMALPEYGYGYPYGRRASAGDGIGLLLVVALERALNDDSIKRCLVAQGYQPI